MSRLPAGLMIYRLVSRAAAPLAPMLLARRAKRGKEHRQRLPERRGESRIARPDGPLIWLHGASVGELASVLPLIERIRARGIPILVTTGTVTSGDLAEQRLPRGVVHQFIPVDVPRFVAPLPRSLAARPRFIRGIRPLAEHDHRSLGSRRADGPGQRAALGEFVPALAAPSKVHRVSVAAARSLPYRHSRRRNALRRAWAPRRFSQPAISSSTCPHRRPIRRRSPPCRMPSATGQ